MLIEIYGAGFANKGAQLMLETTIDKIRSHHPEAKFAINAGADRPPSEVRRLGMSFLWPLWDIPYWKKVLDTYLLQKQA